MTQSTGFPSTLTAPEAFLTTPEVLGKIEHLCNKHFSYDDNQRDECYLYVLEKLAENKYRRLKQYQGRSSVLVFVHTLVNRLCIDFKVMLFGKRRIPKSVAKLGKLAARVYELYCWSKYTLLEIFDILTIEDGYCEPRNVFMKEMHPVEDAPCQERRKTPPPASLTNAEMGQIDIPGDMRNPLEEIIHLEDDGMRQQALKKVSEHIASLPDQDQMLIRLVHGSNHSVAKASRIIGIPSHTARRHLKALHADIRRFLRENGFQDDSDLVME